MPFPIDKASKHSSGRLMKGHVHVHVLLGIRVHGRWSRQASVHQEKHPLERIVALGLRPRATILSRGRYS